MVSHGKWECCSLKSEICLPMYFFEEIPCIDDDLHTAEERKLSNQGGSNPLTSPTHIPPLSA